MNRLKFRIWDTQESKWYAPVFKAYAGELHELTISLDGSLQLREYGNNVTHESIFPDRYEVFQWTGLNDVYGTRIFEGDIVNATEFDWEGSDREIQGVVRWFEGEYQIHPNMHTQFWGSDGSPSLFHVEYSDPEIEVVGNYLQNPELLEAKP